MFWCRIQMGIFVVLLLLESVSARSTDSKQVPMKGTPSFIQPIENASAVIGRDATLNCFIDNAQGFKIAWIRVDTQTILTMNENVISRNHRFYIDHNKLDRQWSLSIREVKPSDQGWYMCQINTDPMMSTTGYLEVLEPPQLIESGISPDLEVREGDRATLRCQAEGNPTPNITWMREDKRRISGGQRHGGVLHFKRVSRGDMGAYLCMAANGIPPIVSRRIHLDVLYSPVIHINLQVVRASVGDKISLNCSITGNPTPSLYWEVDGKPLGAESPNHFLRKFRRQNGVFSNLQVLLTAESERIVTYQCHGNNSEGKAADEVDIHVIERISYGDVPDVIENRELPEETVFLQGNPWELHDEQAPQIQPGKYQEYQSESSAGLPTRSSDNKPKPDRDWPFTKTSNSSKLETLNLTWLLALIFLAVFVC